MLSSAAFTHAVALRHHLPHCSSLAPSLPLIVIPRSHTDAEVINIGMEWPTARFSPSLDVRHRCGAIAFFASSTFSTSQIESFSGSQSKSKSHYLFRLRGAPESKVALPFSISGHEAHTACPSLETFVPFSSWLVTSPHAQNPGLVP